jgi:RNA polymerase sigma-70 factor (ECF subfamily)
MSTITGQDLESLARDGNAEALDQLLRTYERRAYNLAYRMMGNHDDACDALQDAFIRLYTNLHRFRGESTFATWLYRIVTNTCLDAHRRTRRRRLQLTDPTSGEYPGAFGHSETPDEVLLRHDTRRRVLEALGLLSDPLRAVVVLRDLQGLSYEEIGQIIQCPAATVKTRIYRGRQALKAILVETLSQNSALATG